MHCMFLLPDDIPDPRINLCSYLLYYEFYVAEKIWWDLFSVVGTSSFELRTVC